MTILITVLPMVPVLVVLIGFGLWWSRGESAASRETIASGSSRNLTRVVPIAPTRSDCNSVVIELGQLARRESALLTDSLRAVAGERAPLTDAERFVLRVTADRVDVLRAHQSTQTQSDPIMLDVEELDGLRRRLGQLDGLPAAAILLPDSRSKTVA